MIRILPEPKYVRDDHALTPPLTSLRFAATPIGPVSAAEVAELAGLRFTDYPHLVRSDPAGFPVAVTPLDGAELDVADPALFMAQGYVLEVGAGGAVLQAATRAGLVNGLTTLKALISEHEARTGGADGLRVACCRIVDHPSIPVRAVAPTFSWYAGYGRLGFDMQLWGFAEWADYLQRCADNKINQLNMVMYGYWPFELPEYPETVFRDLPMQVWNSETKRFLDIRFSHPNIVEEYLPDLLALAHTLGISVFAYVGLNSYNGGWTIAHPEKRMVPPTGGAFLNDFDSVCLSDAESLDYLLHCMRRIAELGFDGFSLEESEEGFWFCECVECTRRWRPEGVTPGEAKHRANLELLARIRDVVAEVNPDAVIGIRAFRQPPLEKDPGWLAETAASLPPDVVLFWAPALYVPPTEFAAWVDAFGKERIWGRDSEANAITSTMGRLYRTFESNLVRYGDEPNAQSIERDIEQHLSSVAAGVHGINGFVFEWHGLFMHQWAHGNYGWGSTMAPETFYLQSCQVTFGDDLGRRVLAVLQGMLTIHESQIPLFTTPFPFQSVVMQDGDIPRIQQAIEAHPGLLSEIRLIRDELQSNPRLRLWSTHFDRLENAERRNRVIYDLVLAALDYERATDPALKDELLNEVLRHNQRDFDIASEMFFDLNPVGYTGVRSCMMPYHELKRLIHNRRHPDQPDTSVICSGIEALGWLWLGTEEA